MEGGVLIRWLVLTIIIVLGGNWVQMRCIHMYAHVCRIPHLRVYVSNVCTYQRDVYNLDDPVFQYRTHTEW